MHNSSATPTCLLQIPHRVVDLDHILYIIKIVIHEFRWIEWNIDKVEKHGVSPAEAEHVVLSARRPYPRQNGKGKWLVVGRGQGDRVIKAVYIVDPDDTMFVIHAMPLTTRRRRG